jgi:transposase InsO family protein
LLGAAAVIGRLFITRKIAKIAIVEWIKAFYNRKRLHSTIGYVPTVTFEENYWANQPFLT